MRGFIGTCISALLGLVVAADAGVLADGDVIADVQLAPPLALARLDGPGNVSLADYCGRVVALEFWSSDCRACAQSLATLATLEQQAPDDDFAALGVAVDDAVAARAFLAEHPSDVPMLSDTQLHAVDALSIRGVPTVLLIDRKSRIRARIEGFTPKHAAALRMRVHALLQEPRPQSC